MHFLRRLRHHLHHHRSITHNTNTNTLSSGSKMLLSSPPPPPVVGNLRARIRTPFNGIHAALFPRRRLRRSTTQTFGFKKKRNGFTIASSSLSLSSSSSSLGENSPCCSFRRRSADGTMRTKFASSSVASKQPMKARFRHFFIGAKNRRHQSETKNVATPRALTRDGVLSNMVI